MRTLLVSAVCLLCACADDERRPRADGGVGDAALGADAMRPDGSPPLGGRSVGADCTSDDECTDPADAECFTGMFGSVSWPGGFCSKACDPDAGGEQCGTEGICVSAGSSGGGSSISGMFCTTACDSDADCRSGEGYTCRRILSFGYCSPPGL